MFGQAWKDDSLVRTYLAGVRGGIPYAGDQLDVMRRLIRALGRPVDSLLDLGCGDGILTAAVLCDHPQMAATLVDLSEPMLEAARRNLADRVRDARFARADLSDPKWVQAVRGRGPFSAIVSGYAIHHQPHARKQQLFGEIHGLLQPGGLFVNIEHVQSATPWVASLAEELLTDSLYAYHTHNGSPQSRQEILEKYVRRPDKKDNILAPVEVQCEWLRDSGFVDVDCYLKCFEFAVFGGRRAP